MDVKYGLLQNAAARAQFSRRVACTPEDLCKRPAQCPWARLPLSHTFPQRCRAIMIAAFLLSSRSYLRSTVDLYAVCSTLASPFHFRCSGIWHDTSDCLDLTPPSQRASCSVRCTFFSIAVESIPCCSHPSPLDIIIPFQQFCNSRLSVFVHSICHSPVHFWLEGGSSHARLQCHRHRHRQPCAPYLPFDCSDFCFTRACSSSKWGCICLFLETLKPSNGSARHCLCCFHFQS